MPKDNPQVSVPTPLILDLKKARDRTAFERLRSESLIVDEYQSQLEELFYMRNPQLWRAPAEIKQASVADFAAEHFGSRPEEEAGVWVHLPWRRSLTHLVDPEDFYELRAGRNRDLITWDEQRRLRGIPVAIAGCSVGSHAAYALALQGFEHLSIADFDPLAVSNMNRLHSAVDQVGLNKVIITAQSLCELNPFISLTSFEHGIKKENLDQFFTIPEPAKVIVEYIDDLEMKVLIRLEAKKRGVPVLMATDIGDDVMLDVERYDLDPKLPLFHGLSGGVEDVILEKGTLSPQEKVKYSAQIVGATNNTPRMQDSLLQIGTKLPTWPQLGGTAMMAGAIMAYAVRRLALGLDLSSGRTTISPDHLLDPEFDTRHARKAREQKTADFERQIRNL